MHGKVVVITGVTSGLGMMASEKLASMGARIVGVARNRQRGEAALARLRQVGPDADHRLHYADLSRLAEMKRVAAEIAAAEPQIDVLMNNAGAMFDRRRVTEDGLELTFALNHMAYFVVTCGLRQRLTETPGARVVSTASAAHRGASADLTDLQMESGWGAFKAYGRSKLHNILFTRELARRLADTGVTANSLHPGFVATRFGDESVGAFGAVFRFLKHFALTPVQGAETMVFLASSHEVDGVSGEYFHKCKPIAPTEHGRNDEAARQLWEISEQLAAVSAC